MVKTTISVNCGCGYKTDSLVNAQSHATTTGHTLIVLGKVTGDKVITSIK